jgi:hypothetical protein
MLTHVKVLGVLYVALGALGVLSAIVLMVVLGSAARIVGATAEPGDAAVAVPILSIVGTTLVAFSLLLSIPGIVAGWGLLRLRPWARVLGIVLSILNLIAFPFGTILGAYGLWVLLTGETERLFTTPPPASL